MSKDSIQKDSIPYGENPLVDIVKVEDFYNENENIKKVWNNLVFEEYIGLLYHQYSQCLQLGYIHTEEIEDERFKLIRPVQDSVTGEVNQYIKSTHFTFDEYVVEVIKILEKHKQAVFNLLLKGEIDKNEWNELSGVISVCLEYCNKFIRLLDSEKEKVISKYF